MDKSIASVDGSENRMIYKEKSLTPAILGVPSGSHGVKLSSNMNLKDREKLLLKLEEWRQARKEKLTATILAKGKILNNSKLPPTLPKTKIRTISNPSMGTDAKQSQCSTKKNVFDRLYENANKTAVKKPEEGKNEKVAGVKNLLTVQASKFPPLRKVKVPKVILMADDDYDSTSNGTVNDITVSVSVTDNFSEVQNEFEVVNVDGHSNDEPQKTTLSIKEGKIEKNQDEVDTELDKVECALEETSQENTLSALVESCGSENRNEIVSKADELRKDDEDKNMENKKSVCFETPREKLLSAVHLRNKLEDWLSEKGHSIDSYRHLRCFGLNVEKTPVPYHRLPKMEDISNSSFYSTAPNTPSAEVIDESDKENISLVISVPKIDIKDVEGWLGDLHRLIVHLKYPRDRCEEWLTAITKKFPSCTQLAIYWECLAAMNGVFNDLKSAEENDESEEGGEEYETSLAGLLDKLVIDEKCKSASKTERGLSMKNIFQSKTVKFALHEKAVKELDPELGKEARRKVLVATPVRRSARLQTPEKSNIIGSLQSLDPQTRRNISFQPNDALLTG